MQKLPKTSKGRAACIGFLTPAKVKSLFFCLSLCTAIRPLVLQAEPSEPLPPFDTLSRDIDARKGAFILDEFRWQRLAGDYSFKFELRHMPRRGRSTFYQGQLWSTWNEIGPLVRLHLQPLKEETTEELRLLLQNGFQPEAWTTGGDEPTAVARPLRGEELFKPLLAGIVYTPFDLQMPFIYWDDYVYEGKKQKKGRFVHIYLMLPPKSFVAQNPEVAAVRLFLDEKFRALVKAEVLNPQNETLKTFKIISFKKVGKQWIVKKIDLVDEHTHDKTRFIIVSAALNLQLPYSLFIPASLAHKVDDLSSPDFDSLE